MANSPIAYEPAISDPKELQTVLQTMAPAADKVPCYVQQQPARKLKNLQSIPVLFMVGEGSYHRIYDHCLARWLNDAGVKTEYVEMESAGLRGNGHMMMLSGTAPTSRSTSATGRENARPARGENNTRAMPGKNMPTFATDNIARKGFFFAGGKYWVRPAAR